MNQTKIKKCQSCKSQFVIEPDDFDFYEKMKVPAPTFCPECRLQRRLMWRNERGLYKYSCNLCKKDKIGGLDATTQYTVYCKDCWWSDTWDPMKYGRAYDFTKPFFEQFYELFKVVPRSGTAHQGTMVNSEYTNRTSNLKNCYLIFGSSFSEDCLYGTWFNDSKDCIDGLAVQKSERCYECIDCFGCYDLAYSQECTNCTSSAFLFDCRNCDNCFGCVNLRNKSYCVFNKQYSKEKYKALVKQFDLGSTLMIESLSLKARSHALRYIVPALVQRHSRDVSGNWLEGCKNIKAGFSCRKVEDGRYLFALVEAKDVMDYSFWGRTTEMIYDSVNIGYQCSQICFSNELWDQVINAQYSMNCHSSSHCFGCVGLRKKQYCILNKQYTKEEYEELVPKIIQHMNDMPYKDKKGRVYTYGEFFPVGFSPFAYNETLAQEYLSLTKEQALAQGYLWKDPEKREYKITIKPEDLPDHIKDITDDILNSVIGCEHQGKCNEQCTTAFKIIPDEFQFYRKMNFPLPRLCPNCRHYQRLKQRNPLKLWYRRCQCAGEQSDNNVYKNTIDHFHKQSHCSNEFE
ncbi:hypothetical protein MYX07_01500, partial [Patescibacteria group bacterium AH-259-L07]|nr:hypothetical protein [Patescibacteria group bacterium AH-259-L07]